MTWLGSRTWHLLNRRRGEGHDPGDEDDAWPAVGMLVQHLAYDRPSGATHNPPAPGYVPRKLQSWEVEAFEGVIKEVHVINGKRRVRRVLTPWGDIVDATADPASWRPA